MDVMAMNDPVCNAARLKEGEVSMGTTIISCVYDGGVILAADSRTSAGSYIVSRATNKITQLHDKIYILRSGSAADTQVISGYVSYYLDHYASEMNRPPSVKVAASLIRKLAYENKNALTAGMIVAGWDPVEGGSMYQIPLGGTLLKQTVAIGGSGSTFVTGLVDNTFRENMSKDEAKAFAHQAVAHAIARDGSSGGMIRSVTIDGSGVEKNFIPGDALPYGP